jgi:DNA-directed RNA polymerase subunit RPC12/RpoP
MIHEGQRNRDQKLKLLDNLRKSEVKLEKWLSKRCITLYLCRECGLQIFFEPKAGRKLNNPYMSYDYEDFLVRFENDTNFKPLVNNCKNTKQHWSNYCNYICLNCGNGVEDVGNGCKKCKETALIVPGNELSGKPCPVCETALNDGITLKGFKSYQEKKDQIIEVWYNIYRERYNVKKPKLPNYTEEEIIKNNRRMSLQELYSMDYKYILNNPNNALRFEFKDAWMRGYNCVLEWGYNIENKFTLYRYCGIWIEKIVTSNELEQILDLLIKYNFFNRRFFLNSRSIKLDGYTFGLEVKLNDKYKELCIWSIRSDILYEIGMLLLKIAGKKFKDFYEYAW